MGRRRKFTPQNASGLTIAYAATVNGRHLAPTTEVSIRGERGRFRFMRAVTSPSGAEWLDFWGGPKGAEQWRSFYPERVRRVHRLKRTGQGLLETKKEALSGISN
ncbi:hypothetical protein SEA_CALLINALLBARBZ_56 [Arthrobacter phage CallinAllBarbz]|uniref:DUF7246 domain-containing protein n=1 Tax=Arthrobacter phage CallinAllBarbz TaxID=3077790 RepID=A0AA96HG51_9CAUD|nr:hypothetical protein SEA_CALLINALLBARBZ_56 [Arthrobacter phage CallinAllBarbz]